MEGGGGGLSWRSRGLRTGCAEQAVAAAAQDGRTLATTSADQYAICHVQRATALGRRQRRKVGVRSDVLQLRIRGNRTFFVEVNLAVGRIEN